MKEGGEFPERICLTRTSLTNDMGHTVPSDRTSHISQFVQANAEILYDATAGWDRTNVEKHNRHSGHCKSAMARLTTIAVKLPREGRGGGESS